MPSGVCLGSQGRRMCSHLVLVLSFVGAMAETAGDAETGYKGNCVDKGCSEELGSNGLCVDFSKEVDFSHLASSFNLSFGSAKGLCGHKTKIKVTSQSQEAAPTAGLDNSSYDRSEEVDGECNDKGQKILPTDIKKSINEASVIVGEDRDCRKGRRRPQQKM